MENIYNKNYYSNIWSSILKHYSVNSPIVDLGDISRNKIINKLVKKYFVKEIIEIPGEIKINDYGAGNWLYLGGLIGALDSLKNKTITVSGFDFSYEALDFGYRKFKKLIPENMKINIKQCDLSEEIKRQSHESVDCTLCLETLEHLENDLSVIQALIKVTKKGGLVLISVPNKSPFVFSKNWFQYIFLKKAFTEKDIRVGHYRRYGTKELTEILARLVKIEKIYCYGFLFSDYLKDLLKVVEKYTPLFHSPVFSVSKFLIGVEMFLFNQFRVKRSEGFFIVARKL